MNAWDALLQPQQPQMGNNPELNSLMGIDNNNPMSPIQGALLANSDMGRQMTMEMAKSKLAVQMAEQLAQAKIDLAKANPEYSPHVTPYGGILMTTPYSDKVTEAYAGAPGAKEEYATGLAAKTADNIADAKMKNDPSYVSNMLAKTGAEVDKEKALTEQAKANTSYIEGAKTSAEAARAENAGQGKPWGTEDDERAVKTANMKYGVPASDPLGIWDAMNPGVRQKAGAEAAAEIKAGRSTSKRGRALSAAAGSGTPAPASDNSAMPDVGSMLNLSNGIGKGLMDQ